MEENPLYIAKRKKLEAAEIEPKMIAAMIDEDKIRDQQQAKSKWREELRSWIGCITGIIALAVSILVAIYK